MSDVDPALADRLRTIGLDPAAFGEPGDAWRRLHERFGPRVTLIDRYALEAAARGIQPDQLDAGTRGRLGAETLRAQLPSLEFAAGSERTVVDATVVVEYDERWPAEFAAWRRRLDEALGPVAVSIEHVGSTAVPGLAAKPIIDIQVSVRDVEDEVAYVPAVDRTGVPLRASEPGHRYFRPAGQEPRTVQIHVCDAGSRWERDHLLFRDYLRADSVVRASYARLKRDLAERYRDDRLAYTDAKSTFILDTLASAKDWSARVRWRLPPSE